MSDDHTLPLRGGWIMTREAVTVSDRDGRAMKRDPLTLLWAMPGRIELLGSDPVNHALSNEASFFHDQQSALKLLYRTRCGATLDDEERAKLRDARRHWGAWQFEEPDLQMPVKCLTPDGTLYLRPHEWTRVRDMAPYLEMIGSPDITLTEIGGIPSKGRLTEQMFYLRQRGIPKVEALRMVMGNIDRPGMFMLTMHPAYRVYFGLEAA